MFWTSTAYDLMAHGIDTRTTSCKQESHAGAPVGYNISLCPPSVNQVQYMGSLSCYMHLMRHSLHAMDGRIA